MIETPEGVALCPTCLHAADGHDLRAMDRCDGCDDCLAVQRGLAEVFCTRCVRAATGLDGLCDFCREGVPASITDDWLAFQFRTGLRRRRDRPTWSTRRG